MFKDNETTDAESVIIDAQFDVRSNNIPAVSPRDFEGVVKDIDESYRDVINNRVERTNANARDAASHGYRLYFFHLAMMHQPKALADFVKNREVDGNNTENRRFHDIVAAFVPKDEREAQRSFISRYTNVLAAATLRKIAPVDFVDWYLAPETFGDETVSGHRKADKIIGAHKAEKKAAKPAAAQKKPAAAQKKPAAAKASSDDVVTEEPTSKVEEPIVAEAPKAKAEEPIVAEEAKAEAPKAEAPKAPVNPVSVPRLVLLVTKNGVTEEFEIKDYAIIEQALNLYAKRP